MQRVTAYNYCFITNCLKGELLNFLAMYAHTPGQGSKYEFLYYLAGIASVSELTIKDYYFC
jgi:hypothetical protein